MMINSRSLLCSVKQADRTAKAWKIGTVARDNASISLRFLRKQNLFRIRKEGIDLRYRVSADKLHLFAKLDQQGIERKRRA